MTLLAILSLDTKLSKHFGCGMCFLMSLKISECISKTYRDMIFVYHLHMCFLCTVPNHPSISVTGLGMYM